MKHRTASLQQQSYLYFQVSGQLFMLNFSTGVHLLLLTPSLVTEIFGLGIIYMCFVSSKISPKALGELTASPRLGELRVVGAAPLSKNSISLQAESRLPQLLRRRSLCLSEVTYNVSSGTILYYTIHHVIANPSVCLVSIYHSYSRAVEGKEKVGVKHTPMASAGLRAYNGGLPRPQRGSRG